ncbi:MAG: hypothetical protein ACFCU8_00240 [Thermosynechococcaceae cyanobacterium]
MKSTSVSKADRGYVYRLVSHRSRNKVRYTLKAALGDAIARGNNPMPRQDFF